MLWQPTVGHVAHFKVTKEPHDSTNAGQRILSEARARVSEANNIRKATSGRKQAPRGL